MITFLMQHSGEEVQANLDTRRSNGVMQHKNYLIMQSKIGTAYVLEKEREVISIPAGNIYNIETPLMGIQPLVDNYTEMINELYMEAEQAQTEQERIYLATEIRVKQSYIEYATNLIPLLSTLNRRLTDNLVMELLKDAKIVHGTNADKDTNKYYITITLTTEMLRMINADCYLGTDNLTILEIHLEATGQTKSAT